MNCFSHFQVIDDKVLNDLGLKSLPDDWYKMIDLPNTNWLEKSKTKWNVSHVSAESFFENKHGIFLALISISVLPMLHLMMLEVFSYDII